MTARGNTRYGRNHALRSAWTAGMLLAAACIAPAIGIASPVTLLPQRDNTLFEDSDGDTSLGRGCHFFSGRTGEDGAFKLRRATLRFDIAGAVPAGATITRVVLTLHASRVSPRGPSPNIISIHRVTADWGEGASFDVCGMGGGLGDLAEPGDATWIYRFYPEGAARWITPGGDFEVAATASDTIALATSWSSARMIGDVQGWLDQPHLNFGWIMIGDEGVEWSAVRFYSREYTVDAFRPRLQVEFQTVATTGACCDPEGACGTASEADCKARGGSYRGDGTTCETAPCRPPTGACCLAAGACTDTTAARCAELAGAYRGDGSSCAAALCPVTLEPYVDPLPIPPVADPVASLPGGEATYDMEMKEFRQKLHRDLPPTTLWGYAGRYPGPTIEAESGRTITVRWINDLRDALGDLRTEHILPVDPCVHGAHSAAPRTVVHVHGARVASAYDGYPDSTFLPGERAEYIYPNQQLPATMWYHDHALGITRLNMMMGLAGFYLIRDDTERALGLPAGGNEIPLMIQDRSFRTDGSIVYPERWEEEFLGDKILVNGKVWPYLQVKRGRYRFRLLNASNHRAYTLSFSNGDPMLVIGGEGGLVTHAVLSQTVTLLPAERSDVIVDFSRYPPGAEILLTNSAPAPFPGVPGLGVVPDVMKFVVSSETGYTVPVPEVLRLVERIPESSAQRHRDFILSRVPDACTGSRWLINGRGWDDITEFPVLGSTEAWSFINSTGASHPIHIHLVMFQVLDRQTFVEREGVIQPVGDRIPPPPIESGWTDTAPVHPGEILRVIMKFDGYTGRYPYHCHMLEHEDNELMRQFEVVEPPAEIAAAPVVLRLARNPTASSVTFTCVLREPARVRLGIHDLGGRLVRIVVDEDRPAGSFSVDWDGTDGNGRAAKSGIYVVRLVAGTFASSQKLVMVR